MATFSQDFPRGLYYDAPDGAGPRRAATASTSAELYLLNEELIGTTYNGQSLTNERRTIKDQRLTTSYYLHLPRTAQTIHISPS